MTRRKPHAGNSEGGNKPVCLLEGKRGADPVTDGSVDIFPQSPKCLYAACFNLSGMADFAEGRPSRKSRWASMIRFVSPYLASRILLVSSYVFTVTTIPSTNNFGSPSTYPCRKMCLLIVESEASLSVEDRNCSQNRDEVSTLPAKGSSLIVGSFTECVTGPIGTVAVG